MPIRFRRRFKIAPGLYINLGKKSVSTSTGTTGAWLTQGLLGHNDTRASGGIPGTGLGVTEKLNKRPKKKTHQAKSPQPSVGSALWGLIVIIFVIWLIAR